MKKLIMATPLVLSLLLVATPALAIKPNGPAADHGLNNPGPVKHLELYEKDPSTWQPVDGGAWGRLTFSAASFVFNGHGLEAGEDYTLIRYQDPWPGSPVCLGSGTANEGGNLNLSGDMLSGSPKVWLVLSSDVSCGTAMTGWHPTEYLFEYDLI